jgi:hypothetical protein
MPIILETSVGYETVRTVIHICKLIASVRQQCLNSMMFVTLFKSENFSSSPDVHVSKCSELKWLAIGLINFIIVRV